MSTSISTDIPAQPEAPAEHCGQCGAPAAHEQRYCVNCGFHRRIAPDPVARYLSEASAARARVAAAASLAARRRHTPRLGMRSVGLLVALALLIGILVGNGVGGGTAPTRSSSAGANNTAATAAKHASKPKPTTKLTNATGSNYLRQEKNLPNSVTP